VVVEKPRRPRPHGTPGVAVSSTRPVPAPAPPPVEAPVQKPMTNSERAALERWIRKREAVLRTAAEQRSAELEANFEQQIASIYSYDQDEVWAQAYKMARDAAHEASAMLAERCKQLGIPEKFAPSLELVWHGRGQSAVSQRREELRRVAKSRIAAIQKEAFRRIGMETVQLQGQVLAHGLTSEAAKAFLDSMPAIETMMPPVDIAEIEHLLEGRGVQWYGLT
jgi:DNA-nicking Smr family endonuclease